MTGSTDRIDAAPPLACVSTVGGADGPCRAGARVPAPGWFCRRRGGCSGPPGGPVARGDPRPIRVGSRGAAVPLATTRSTAPARLPERPDWALGVRVDAWGPCWTVWPHGRADPSRVGR